MAKMTEVFKIREGLWGKITGADKRARYAAADAQGKQNVANVEKKWAADAAARNAPKPVVTPDTRDEHPYNLDSLKAPSANGDHDSDDYERRFPDSWANKNPMRRGSGNIKGSF